MLTHYRAFALGNKILSPRALWTQHKKTFWQGFPKILPRSSPIAHQRRAYSSSRPDAFHSQLEDPANATLLSSISISADVIPQTLTEKIVQRHCVGLAPDKCVRSGDYVTLKPHHCMTHDNSFPVAAKFKAIGASTIHDKAQIVITLDHDVQNKSESNLGKYRKIEEFARHQGVDFYPAGRGIGHQVMVEEGYAMPGTLVVASDSHSNMYGGVGCLGTPVVRTDAASIWATGRTWWQVPPIARINLQGTLPKGVTGKDVIVALCGLFSKDEVLNHAIEFTGSEETMKSLPVDARLTIANMTTEWGALAGLFPIDSVLQGWMRYKATEAALYRSSELSNTRTHERFNHPRLDEIFANTLSADKGAKYAKQLHINLSTLSPYVSGPNSVKIATPLSELAAQNININKAYLVSCTNSRASDLAAAANVFRDAAKQSNGKTPRVADGVELYISAASKPEQLTAEGSGDWQVLLEAGAIPLTSGCGPCIGLGAGLLQPNEVGISASNRNFKGRMGSTEAKAYLASPEVVAASAYKGRISGPGWYEQPKSWSGVIRGDGDGVKEEDRMITAEEALEKVIGQLDHIVQNAEQDLEGNPSPVSENHAVADSLTEVLSGFPKRIEGEIVFCDADNLNTDGIYPGRLTYENDVTREAMAEACMSNYDPSFSATARAGDVLVSGYNLGCGSSREQAATAVLAKGINLVVAGSFGNIFSRNSINNALMGVELPRLVHRLREVFSSAPAERPQQDVEEPSRNSESLDSPPPAPLSPPRLLTRRTGWKLVWDVERSKVEVQEGEGGFTWSQKVGELPPNVQEIIACGGLEGWVKKEIEAES